MVGVKVHYFLLTVHAQKIVLSTVCLWRRPWLPHWHE